jgi:hypothetical protein
MGIGNWFKKKPATKPATPVRPPIPGNAPPLSPDEPIAGGPASYDTHIESRIASNHLPLIEDLAADRMKLIASNWARLAREERLKWWSCFLWAVSGPESSRNRTLIYVEDTMDTDPVTGYQVRSEGLLQLSYQDIGNYKFGEGAGWWTHDREMAIADYKSKTRYGNPDRKLLGAINNLSLGLWIIHKQLFTFSATRSFEDALGRYWLVMQKRHKDEFGQVLSGLEKRLKERS